MKCLDIALQGMDYLMAGCPMSKEERIAIQVFYSLVSIVGLGIGIFNWTFQNVVSGRQPKLIQLQPEESDEDEGEVILDF